MLVSTRKKHIKKEGACDQIWNRVVSLGKMTKAGLSEKRICASIWGKREFPEHFYQEMRKQKGHEAGEREKFLAVVR